MSENIGSGLDNAWCDKEALLLLAEARKLLENCICYEATIEQIASLLVYRLAMWCSIDLVSPDKKIFRAAVTHRDPAKADLAKEMLLNYPASPTATRGVYRVIETGKSIIIPEAEDAMWARRAEDEPRLYQLMLELGSTSYMCVPLIARGSVIGSIMLLTGERTFTEDHLRTAEELARSIAMAMDNVYMFRSMQEAVRVRDEFLATLSHEIRTPMSVISGWIDVLKNEKPSEESFQHALEVLERNSQLQARLINDLLDLSKIKASKLHLNLSLMNLSELLRACCDSLVYSAKGKNISFEVKSYSANAHVMGDSSHLQRMILNVLTNALKFTPAHGKIAIELKEISNDIVQLSVTDTGVGIEPSFVPYVFEAFYQESGRTTRVHEGLGLGLAITKHIVEAHQGTISVTSLGRDKGAEFIIQLPLSSEKVVVAAAPTSRSIVGLLQDRQILVVDDSEDIRHLVTRFLEKSGAKVTGAGSAKEALDLLEEANFDLLLSDICMPEMDGYELISHLRKSPVPHHKDLIAVALTAFAREEEEQKSLSAGFNAHLSKPVGAQQLVENLVKLLDSNKQ